MTATLDGVYTPISELLSTSLFPVDLFSLANTALGNPPQAALDHAAPLPLTEPVAPPR